MIFAILSILITVAPARAAQPRHSDCETLLGAFLAETPQLPLALAHEFEWRDYRDYLIARPQDLILADKVSLLCERVPGARAWRVSLRVVPLGTEELKSVVEAFSAVQRFRVFKAGFRGTGRAGELPRGLGADFSSAALPNEADLSDGFKVIANVLSALRGQALTPFFH